ncbi:MAG: TPM domain-containing protein [Bacteroidales bacterium]
MGKPLFTKEEQQQIVDAIKLAEQNTSGEIRIHIEKRCKGDALHEAVKNFGKLKMHKTTQRNGVLFYFAYEDRKFAIYGDEGINNKVPNDFWDKIKDDMQASFKRGNFLEAICQGIEAAGKQLKFYFPYDTDDQNELSDDISFGG